MTTCLKAKIAVVAAAAAFAAGAGEFSANGCRVAWDDTSLSVGNALFSRGYAVSGGVLRTVSFRAADGVEWQKPGVGAAEREPLEVTAANSRWSPVGVEGVRVLAKFGNGRSAELWLFPDVPGVVVKRSWTDETGGSLATDIVRDYSRRFEYVDELKKVSDGCDRVAFGPAHVKATETVFRDQTDMRDTLAVSTERMLAPNDLAFAVSASALDCRDVLTGDGMLFVRLAPMPASRPVRIEDFILDGNRGVAILANGYPLAELAYRGGEAGMRRAAVAFQRAIRPYRPGRDGVLLSNTWGGGNGDGRINQEFLLKEIDAGAKIGVDVIQLDDGWQQGRTPVSSRNANKGRKKAYSGYWDADPDFWKEDRERFPDGLSFLARKAKEKGMRFGIWFGPDSCDDAANWEKDAACLLDFHSRLGIDYFKMDTMKTRSPLALSRGRAMFDRMMDGSGGAMVFDLDCTADERPGYFGMMDIGPVFVENRYTASSRYWPHHTLKNLWDLSHLVDSVRLRMEFCNPDVNREKYGDSPLGLGRYRPDTLFATVIAASPLAWMELSDVSEESIAALAPLVRSWKAERDRWYGGVIHPVANRPDGVSWTGFVSESPDGGGYALMFRELSEDDEYTLDLRPVFGERNLSVDGVVGGRGEARVDGGRLAVRIPEKLDFVWVRLRSALTADFAKEVAPVRPEIHSSGFGPTICSQTEQDLADVKSMGFKYARTHDWALIGHNQRVCDYFHIFPLMHLDAKNPENYHFGPTDYLLGLTREKAGLDVFFRLGTSIEHSGGKVHFNAVVPGDFDKVAEIFAATVRHYNHGWADGFDWGVKYWEIWNEPDGIENMWCPPDGIEGLSPEELAAKRVEYRGKFVKFFVKALKRLKSEFGDTIKVGGPALSYFGKSNKIWFEEILDACRAAEVKPDFLSWHGYVRDPMQFNIQAGWMRELCDSRGFRDCELIVDEWHYFGENYSWSDMQRSSDPAAKARVWDGPDGHNGIRSACFTLATLSNMQRSKLDQAYFYGCSHTGAWGFKDALQRKYKVFYALKLFGDVVRENTTICASESAGTVTLFPVKSANGRKSLLVTDYGGSERQISVDVNGVAPGAKTECVILDHCHDLAPHKAEFKNGRLSLVKPDSHSAAFFVTFTE